MEQRATARQVPQGWQAIREDFEHYCRVEGAEGGLSRLRLLLTARSFWSLALYRYGRWVWSPESPRALKAPLKASFHLLDWFVMRASRALLPPSSHIHDHVWFGSGSTIIVGLDVEIGAGCRLYGENTLGIAGRAGHRGTPRLGQGCVLGPGAVVVGPVDLPAGTIVGPNTVITRTPPHAGPWSGAPARPVTNPAGAPIPPIT